MWFPYVLLMQEGSALAYILDQLLPQCQRAGDKDCPGLAQVLLASIAASNHSPDAQMLLIGEIKGALGRALSMPESSEKHSRIQALTSKTYKCSSCETTKQNGISSKLSPSTCYLLFVFIHLLVCLFVGCYCPFRVFFYFCH